MYRHIKSLLTKDKIEKALSELQVLVDDNEVAYNLIHQSGRFNALKSEKNQGIVSFQEAKLETDRIRIAILDLIKELEKDNEVNRSIKPKLLNNYKKLKIAGLTTGFSVLLVVLVWTAIQLNNPNLSNNTNVNNSTSGTKSVSGIYFEKGVEMSAKEDESPNIISNDNVSINYGSSNASQASSPDSVTTPNNKTMRFEEKPILKTEGKRSGNIISQENVNINFSDADWEIADTTRKNPN